MPHKYFEDQFDDEEVLLVFRKHPIVMRKGFVIASLALLAGPLYTMVLTLTRTDAPPSTGFFFLSLAASAVLSTIVFFPSWISWFFSVFIVTDQRLIQITQKGLFHRSVIDMRLNQIQMVNYQIAGLQETLLGFGTIMMQTFVGDLVIHDIHHPAATQKKLLEILRQQGVAAVTGPADTSRSTARSNEEEMVEEDEA